ncbi:ATP-binding cassette domain-containing protein [Frondihabitans australicus]|uniref:Molybdate transport system permease protein n=1 Tax=Frondihabitans australicus TaxID=386892 RepID=A0A495ICZ3_9MICO|nr:ATP-binding cassette domain-containing protein [Frondihabitans australicus]RKR73328.1 molybdate transport system permease protein [Frondihabitans australicus]
MARRSPLPAGSPRALRWLAALLAVYLLGPIVAFAVRFALPGDHGFSEPGLWSAFATSVLSATVATAIIFALGVPLAWWLAASDSRISRIAGVLVQLPLALPPVMSGIVLVYVIGPYTPLGTLFGDGLTDSFAGVVIAQTFVAAPFLVIGARSAFRGLDPALDAVAASLGHRPWARFVRVALPAAGDGIRAALVLTWLRALGEYGATALIAYHPYTLPVFVNVQFQGSGLPTTQAPTALALGVAVVAIAIGLVPVRRRRAPAPLPSPREPDPTVASTIGFDIALRRGAFRLSAATGRPGRRIAVLGPSGAGKTLTLRAIAGLVDAGSNHVDVDGHDVSPHPAESRSIGYVAQGGALLPRRTVWQQVTFGVGADPAAAHWWLETLGVAELATRLPDELSGGQRQRVALAQALSRAPSVILLDEPFSALDGPIRDELRAEFRRLQRDRGLSTVVVTHDPEEAAYLADDVIVLDEGRVLQQGRVADVYRAPVSPRVAGLVGIRGVNAGSVGDDGILRAGSSAIVPWHDRGVRDRVQWAVRPEAVRLDPDGHIAGVVVDVIDLGGARVVEVRLDGGAVVTTKSLDAASVSPGDACAVSIDSAGISVWKAPD